MNVESQEFSSQETISEEYETHYVEGFLDETPRGRMANYMSAEDNGCVSFEEHGARSDREQRATEGRLLEEDEEVL
jgi:hypothetical protein